MPMIKVSLFGAAGLVAILLTARKRHQRRGQSSNSITLPGVKFHL
jgi:hypothetical protein